MATDEQTSALRDYKLAVADAFDRRRQWKSVSAEIVRALQARVDELKRETDVGLVLSQHGERDDRTVQLSFGASPVWWGSETTLVESGATMLINVARNGFVQFFFVRSHVEGDPRPTADLLGREDPLRASAEVDKYLQEFLARAAQSHWSHIKP
jgi:hypothetical protein